MLVESRRGRRVELLLVRLVRLGLLPVESKGFSAG